MSEHMGQQFGNYRLLHRVGHGGFADVYLGSHIHLETQAAIKVLHIHLTGEGIEQFRQEARMIARLEHPHIVHILDFGVQEGTPFLVMSYAPNGTVRQRHPPGSRVALPIVVSYVRQVASALHYAHERHVIHRDIKPENLLIGANDEVLLSDFGIARIVSDSQSLQTHEFTGATAYMAPEQLGGHPRYASDQYSLGILTYEWLSGQRPFEGEFTELALKVSTMPMPPLRAKVPSLPPMVEEVITTALQKEPRQRFASVQAFAVALEQACGETPSQTSTPGTIPSRPTSAVSPIPLSPSPIRFGTMTPPDQPLKAAIPSTPVPSTLSATNGGQSTISKKIEQTPLPVVSSGTSTPPVRSGRSRRVMVMGLVGLVAAGGLGAGIIWLLRSQSGQSSSVSSHLPTTVPENTRLIDYTSFGFDLEHTHFNPVEQQLSPSTVAQLKQYWVARTGATINSSPTVANDIVYIGSDDHRLYALNATTGKPVWIATTGGRVYSSPAISKGIVYVGSSDGNLYAFDATSGKVHWTASTANQIYSSPLVANGRVYVGSFDTNLYAFDAATGQLLWRTAIDGYIVSSPALSSGNIYIGSGNGQVHALDALTGTIVWSTSIGSSVTSSPAAVNGRVYIGSSDRNLYALDATTGKVHWTAPNQDSVASSPAVAKGIVYIGSADSHISAYAATTGKLLWSTQTYNQVNSSPTIANGVLYIGSWDGLVYACDATTGKILWTGYTADHIFSSPAVVNGVIYIGSWDTNVYAFRLAGARV